MNLEQLTKTQIILLTLLVSFMTSIATGIVTVSLVDQAPPAVTQTINRVVERTVERVVSPEGEDGESVSGEVVTREVQVIVKENDLVPSAVADMEGSMVRLYTASAGDDGNNTVGTFLGLGFMVSENGLIATDAGLVAPARAYMVVVSNGSAFEARLKNSNDTRSTALLEVTGGQGAPTFKAAKLVNLSTIQLGQTVIALSGRERNSVATGIISDIELIDTATFDAGKIGRLSTSIADISVLPGTPLVDLFGSVVGMYTTRDSAGANAVFTPIATVKQQLAEVVSASQ